MERSTDWYLTGEVTEMEMIELKTGDTVRIVGEPGIVCVVTEAGPLDRATRRQTVHLRQPDARNDRVATVQVIESVADVWPVRVILRDEPSV